MEAREPPPRGDEDDLHHLHPVRDEQGGARRAIADVVLERKLPQLLDVRDESTDDVRIELELKKDADAQLVLAYLFKNTPLQTTFAVNLTCLVPTENPDVGRPERLDLKEMLWHFLDFRLDVVTQRLQHELAELARADPHPRGFATIFDALDEILKIIRASEGKADAAEKIMARFKLDEEQIDAILELKLYRLARLEILVIQEELEEKKKRAGAIEKLLARARLEGVWGIVREELERVEAGFGTPASAARKIEAVGEEHDVRRGGLIVDEDTTSSSRATAGSSARARSRTRRHARSRGRRGRSPSSPGTTQGERRLLHQLRHRLHVPHRRHPRHRRATATDPEALQVQGRRAHRRGGVARSAVVGKLAGDEEHYPETLRARGELATATALTFGLEAFVEPSTRSGRRYARPSEGATIVGVELVHGDETRHRGLARSAACSLCAVDEMNVLAGAGQGVLADEARRRRRAPRLQAVDSDRTRSSSRRAWRRAADQHRRYKKTGRGGKGHEVIKRGALHRGRPRDRPRTGTARRLPR